MHFLLMCKKLTLRYQQLDVSPFTISQLPWGRVSALCDQVLCSGYCRVLAGQKSCLQDLQAQVLCLGDFSSLLVVRWGPLIFPDKNPFHLKASNSASNISCFESLNFLLYAVEKPFCFLKGSCDHVRPIL